MATKLASFTLIGFVSTLGIFSSIASAYNVVGFGARGDGKTDCTLSFARAWQSACSSARPAMVYVPRGTYLLKPVTFSGPCRSRIEFKIDGKIVAPNNYYVIGSSESWIKFYKVSRLSINGGSLDAKGAGFWDCRKRGHNCPAGAMSLSIMWCNDVQVNGLISYNSQIMHIGIVHSSSIKMNNIRIRAPSGSPNTDGIHIQSSNGVNIIGAIIQTGDDCVSIGPGSSSIFISKLGCGPGHGVSIGSLGNGNNEAGVQNVVVTDSIFTKTQNGVRVKTWARPSNGYAKNLVFKNLIMNNVGYPIIIDQRYCPSNSCPHQASGVKVSQVTYKNIKGTSSTQAAMKFDCSSSAACTGITVQDIKLTFVDPRLKRPALTYCSHAHGTRRGFVSPRTCF